MSQDKIEYALRRRAQDPEHSQRVKEHFEQQSDLYSYCSYCKTRITGTMKELLAHGEACIAHLIGDPDG